MNHRGWISVFEIDHPSGAVPAPTEFPTQGGDPSSQKNSIAMTQLRGVNDPIKCVVVTNVKQGSLNRTWVHVLNLSTGTPASELTVQLNTSDLQADNPPHDVRITPDDKLAVVSAGGVVALIDLTPLTGAELRGEWPDPTALRQFDYLADSLVVTNTQAVAIAAVGSQQAWKADVFDISTSGLTWKHGEFGLGQPHDLARSNDGTTAVIRTTEHILVLEHIDLGSSSIVATAIPSPSGRMSTFDLTFDSVIVSRAWVKPAVNGGQGGGPRHFAAAIGRDYTQPVPGTRVEIVDLTLPTPAVVHTEVIRDAAYPDGAAPSSIQLRQGGQGFAVRCNAAPHDIDPDNPPVGYVSATGEDVWFFTLLDPVGSVFQYEMTHSPLALSDPLDLGRTAVVNVSSPYSQGQGDTGHVQTSLVID